MHKTLVLTLFTSLATLNLHADGSSSTTAVEDELKALRADVEALKGGHAGDVKGAGLQVWAQLTGFYTNRIAAGNGADGVPLNRGQASGIVDLGWESQATESLSAAVVLRLNSAGVPEAFDLWAEQTLPLGLSLRAGFLDLTGVFDASSIANDEKSQFIRSEFVDNPTLGQGANAAGARLHWQLNDAIYIQAALQDRSASAIDPLDNLFSIVEAGGKLGGSELKLWARENSRGKQGPVPAWGLVLDHAQTEKLKFFARFGQEFLATGLEHDAQGDPSPAPLNGGGISGAAPFIALNGGLEWTGALASRPQDRLGAAWGSEQAGDTSKRDFAEAYYALTLSDKALFSLHYQADFSRLLDPIAHDWDGDTVADSITYGALPDQHQLVVRLNLAF